MPYAIQELETLSDAVHRIMDELIDRARRQLTDPPSPREKRVHNARKRFKEGRALLRLVREPLGPAFDAENRWFRDAGRDLAAVRDADVVVETLDKLELPKQTHDRIRSRLNADRAEIDVDALIATTVQQLDAARRRAGTLPVIPDTFDAIAAGLQRVYRDGRRARERARTAAELHEWRKHVKTHWYHVQLLEHLEPQAMNARAAELDDLAHLLGDHHDLHVLRESVNGAGREVVETIDLRQTLLEQQAQAIGSRVYAERPDDFVARIGRLWSAWR